MSCFSSRMFFHESPVLLIATGTFSMLKSVGIIEDSSSHRYWHRDSS